MVLAFSFNGLITPHAGLVAVGGAEVTKWLTYVPTLKLTFSWRGRLLQNDLNQLVFMVIRSFLVDDSGFQWLEMHGRIQMPPAQPPPYQVVCNNDSKS